MKIQFDCPSCAAAGSADEAFAGRSVRCKHCGHHFAIPIPGAEPEVYVVEDAGGAKAREDVPGPALGSVFVASRGGEPTTAPTARKPKRSAPQPPARARREHERTIPWRAWLVRGGGAAVVVLVAVGLFAPHGVWAVGCVLMAVGSVMVLAGYWVGAYAAFGEDFLYGFFYLAIPLYTAYYLVTRWEDLWPWFACSTTGVVFVMLGTQMVRSTVVV